MGEGRGIVRGGRIVDGARPLTANQLHGWLRAALDVDVPRRPLIDGSSPPFSYLEHAFFDVGSARDCVVWAPRGGGKTFLGAVATLLDLIFKPGVEVRILGGSLEQSEKMHRHLRSLLEAPALRGLVDGRMTERRIALINGSRAEIMAQSERSVRGSRPQILRCDEVELFRPEVWEAAQLTTRSRQCGPVHVRGAIEALSTMHRPYGLMAELVRSCGPDRRLFRWTMVDTLARCEPQRPCDPCALLDECDGRAKRARGHIAIDDAIKMKSRVGAAAWEAEMLCLRPQRDDLVLPEFDREIHVVDHNPAPDGAALLCGMDFGFRAPTVILWALLDVDGILSVVDERAVAERVVSDHVEAIKNRSWGTPEWVGVDPAGAQVSDQTGKSAISILRSAGLEVRRRTASIERGLNCIRARLAPASGEPRLYVHARCRKLIESLETYHYPENSPQARSGVKDGSDHAVDALRYLVLNLDAGAGAKAAVYW